MRISEGLTNQVKQDRLLATLMDPQVLAYCEQLRNQGIDFEIVRVPHENIFKGYTNGESA